MSEQLYIPYLATAEAIVEGASTEEVMLRIFPSATASQLEQATSFILGIAHDCIELSLSFNEEDPTALIDTYRAGADEGYGRAIQELRKNGGL